MAIAVIEWNYEFLDRGWNPVAENIFDYTVVEIMERSLDFLIAIDELLTIKIVETLLQFASLQNFLLRY